MSKNELLFEKTDMIFGLKAKSYIGSNLVFLLFEVKTQFTSDNKKSQKF